jgi:hypothetical protein
MRSGSYHARLWPPIDYDAALMPLGPDRVAPAASTPAARSRRLWGALAGLLVSAGFWSPAFRVPLSTGFGDWQMVHHNWEVGYVALTRFGQWPLWDPSFCGGITAFGNPEAQHFSPLFVLALVLGTTLATKAFLVLHASAGLCGMYLFARRAFAVHPAAASLAALAWGCSGFFAWHGAGGHATFLPFYFAPWLLLALRRSERDLHYAIAVAALLVLVLLEGGTYPFPYFVLLLGVEGLARLRAAGTRRSVSVAAAVAALTLLLGAIRLLPVRAALARMPRLTQSDDALALPEVLQMLTAREHEWRYAPHRFVWPEYGSFVGWGVVVLAGLGVVVSLRRKRYALLAGLAIFLLLMLGERGAFYPWALLHHLPVFDSLRVPSRFAVLFTFYLALCAALALDEALRLWAVHVAKLARVGGVAGFGVVALLGADLFVVNLHTINRWDGPPISQEQPAARFHLVPAGNFQFLYASLPHKNLGIAACYAGGMNWVVSPALWFGDVPQARFAPGYARLQSLTHTPNELRVHVIADQPTRMILNQNFDPDWQSDLGRVLEDRGRLAVELPAGEHELRLRYRPATLLPAVALFGLGCIVSALWLVRVSRRRRADAR